MLNTFFFKAPTILCCAFITYNLSSCHVVKYELALPQYSHKSHIVKRKRFTFPPDSMVRDWNYYEFFKVPIDMTLDGYSIYKGDTMIHNGVRGGYLPDTADGFWIGYKWTDSVIDPCSGIMVKEYAE